MDIDWKRLLRPNRLCFSLETGFLFLVYIILVGIGVFHHEPWLDEVHPWMMVQEEGLRTIIFERLHWDAHTGLWYLLLKCWAQFLPGNGLLWIAYLLGVWNAALFLFYSRLPLWIRIGFAFSFFFFYQNPIVSRSYVLYPILFWGLMRNWDRNLRRPWTVGILLALIASVSVHGIVFGAGAILGMLLEYSILHKRFCFNRNIIVVSLIYGAVTLFWIYCLFPVLQPLDRHGDSSFSRIEALLTLFTAIPWLTAVIILFLGIVYIQIKGRISWLIPILFLVVMFVFVYYAPWHEGILFAWGSVIFVRYFPILRFLSARMRGVILALLGIIFMIQMKWAASGWVQDYQNAFSGSKAAAEYIREKGWKNEGINGYGHFNVTLNYYFNKNIFSNRERFPKRYYSWNYPFDLAYPVDWSRVGGSPTIVVHQTDESVLPLQIPHYDFVYRFKGKVFWKDTFALEDNYDLYRRTQ